MSFSAYVRAIWRNGIVVLALAVVGGGVGYAMAATEPDMYRSTASVLVTSDRGDSTTELVQGNAYVQNLVATYVLLARSELVLAPVMEELGIEGSPRALAPSVSASAPLNSVIIDLSATSRSPQLAQQIAGAVAESLTRVVEDQVSPTTEDGTSTIRLTTIQSAELPRFAYAPNTRLNVIAGVAIGLVLGVAFAVTRTLVWQTVRSANEVTQMTGVPVIGEIVGTKGDNTLPGSLLMDPRGIESESMRSFAANLSFLRMGEGLRSFVISSASPAESKSSVVTALGLTLAEGHKRILIVDADLRHPSLATLTQLEGSVGLTDVLRGTIPLDRAVQPWGVAGLDVLTAGAVPPNPAQVLASDAMRNLLAEAREAYDIVIVDSAPLLPVTDAKWLGHMTDGALLVTRYERTQTRALRRVVADLEGASVPILGVVISRMPRRARARYGESERGYALASEQAAHGV